MEILDTLQELGLTRNEARVYLAVVRSSGMAASDAAAITGINRPNIYDIFKKLESKGFVGSFRLNNKTNYKAMGVAGVQSVMEEKLMQLKALAAELEQQEGEDKECEVAVFSGRRILRVLQNDINETKLKEKFKESVAFGVDDRKFMGLDKVVMTRFFEAMKENGLTERVIVDCGNDFFPGPQETTEYRSLPGHYFDSHTSIVVYGHKVGIVIFSETPFLILVKSRRFAQSHLHHFEFLWKMAKKVKRKS